MRNFENKEKIVQVSGGLKVISFLIMFVIGYGIIAGPIMWLVIKMLPSKNGLTALSGQLGPAMIANVMEFMVWWNFWIFFSRLKEGHLFDALTVKRLMNAGRWKIAVS